MIGCKLYLRTMNILFIVSINYVRDERFFFSCDRVEITSAPSLTKWIKEEKLKDLRLSFLIGKWGL